MTQTARAEISLSNIAANWRDLDQFFETAETGAVVKADAYGHSDREVAIALAKAGCRTFFDIRDHPV